MEELIREAKDLVIKIRPPKEYGECYDTERLYNILEELEGMTKPREGDSIGLSSDVSDSEVALPSDAEITSCKWDEYEEVYRATFKTKRNGR